MEKYLPGDGVESDADCELQLEFICRLHVADQQVSPNVLEIAVQLKREDKFKKKKASSADFRNQVFFDFEMVHILFFYRKQFLEVLQTYS